VKALSPWVKRSGREADHSLAPSAEVKNGGAVPPLPHVFIAWCLINYAEEQLYVIVIIIIIIIIIIVIIMYHILTLTSSAFCPDVIFKCYAWYF
jgi:hypothetical protein